MAENIHPIFDRILSREDKENMLNQRAVVVWLTGLSGSGKSTIAQALEATLHEEGYFTKLLDGDNIRVGLSNNLSFSEEDRTENIRRIAEAAKLFLDGGVICLCSFVSPTIEIRELARNIIGTEDFLEVYVNAPLEVCEGRDVKGLYKKAREGKIPQFTGIDSPFEAPATPFLELRTDEKTLDACREELFEALLPIIGKSA
ncbi:MAG: adenylyl-sulfate kinase [Bacteroidia bacterium]|nr:adenylyl-sulfate kinase [Bacteroidia bacterium]